MEFILPEKALLLKRLWFYLRQKSNDRGKLVEDTKAFRRRMRLESHFSICDDLRSKAKYPDFIRKDDLQSSKQDCELETLITSVKSDITSHKPTKPIHDNLTMSDGNNLSNLQKHIGVIKPANKGSIFVVMDSDQFITEAERQLGYSTFSKLLDHDPTLQFAKQVSGAVVELFE